MNRALLPPLLLGAALLAVALAELASSGPPPAIVASRIAPHPASALPARIADSGDGDTILARPLFSADRRPAAEKHAQVAANAVPRLSAILMSAASRRVVFDDGGKPLVAGEGGRAGPYTIMSIAADRVVVISPDGSRTLRPTPIPSDDADQGSKPAEPASGLSLLQQLQRGQVPHYAVPPPPTIQSLIARMRAQH